MRTRAQPAATARSRSDGAPVTPGVWLQRKCVCESSATEGGACEQCAPPGTLQAAPAFAGVGAIASGCVPASVHQVLRTPGSRLDTPTRAYFEPLYGHDFGRVQVHADSRAAASARDVNALAYTVGDHVVFGSGRFSPHTEAGRGLLAHELAHTIQQEGAPANIQRLSLGQRGDAMEQEADRAAAQALRGAETRVRLRAGERRVQGFTVTNEAAGGCGICYDVAFPGQGAPNAGRVAHTVVQGAFLTALSGLGSFRLVEFPFSAPGDENGRLDLAVATPTGFAIGEIKAATPNGEAEGVSDLQWYTQQISAAHPGSTVVPLVTAIPVGAGLPMPDALATAAGCTAQGLGVVMMRPGLYGYFCEPPFSQVRRTCTCRPPTPPPLPVPVEKDVKDTKDVKERADKKERDRPPVGGPLPVPVAARDVAAALAAAAALTFAASKLKGLAKGRLLAAATAIAVVVLLSKGAEASVGLEGEDPIETLLKSADARGQHIPDDIKDAMRKDPELRKLLEKAAKTGKVDEAQREAAEKLTRLVAAHRDEFTEEELDALLKATEGAKGAMPNGDMTVESVKKAIAAKKKGGSPSAPAGSGSGSGAPASPPKAGYPGAPPSVPVDTPAMPTAPKTPAERLVEGMARPASGGPKFTESARGKLLAVARAVNPPLTDAEVDGLLKHLQSAAGKTEDEVVESLRQRVTAVRAAKPGAKDVKTAPGDTPAEEPAAGDKTKGTPTGPQAGIDKTDPKQAPQADEKATIAHYDKFIAKMDKIAAGKAFLALPGDLYETGKVYGLTYIGRDASGVPFVGQVSVTIGNKTRDAWNLTIAAGGVLYTRGRRYGVTRTFTDKVTPPPHLRIGGTGTAGKRRRP